MKIFLFLGSRRGYAVLKKLLEVKAEIAGILCLIEDPHEEQYHLKISALATQHQIPIFYSNQIKPSAYKEVLEKIKPDIAFAIGWRYLIKKDAYTLPPKGTLIIHDSLLPKYRGFAPMNWAIINGETETGVTLFYIDDGTDSGPIVDQMATEIKFTDTAKTLDEKIIQLYEEIIIRNLPALAAGTAKAVPQNERDATYTCKRTPEDGLINWQCSAVEIYNLIRALTHPFPGAFTFLEGKKIFVWEARLSKIQKKYVGSIPGRVVAKDKKSISVLTGNEVIELLEIGEESRGLVLEETHIGVKNTFV